MNPKDLIFAGENSPWEIALNMEFITETTDFEKYKHLPPGYLKYLPLLPVERLEYLDPLSEYVTPFILSHQLGDDLTVTLYFKLESKNRTGSFKDRGSLIDVAMAKELNATGIVLASTGNMAASCACYCSVHNLPCFVVIPEGIPRQKLAQIACYNAHVIQIGGNFNDAESLSKRLAELPLGLYLAGDYAFRVEGQKTAVFEIVDQLDYNPPDMIVIPVGCGTNLAAYYKGLQEYKTLGLIDKIPQLIGIQAEGAAPIVRSFQAGRTEIIPFDSVKTKASAIAVADPLDGIKVLDAVYQTNGKMISVTDEEILEAQKQLAQKEGFFVEFSSASAIAGLLKLEKEEDLKYKRIVCILTGDGLKDSLAILSDGYSPICISSNEKEFLALYNKGYFNRQ